VRLHNTCFKPKDPDEKTEFSKPWRKTQKNRWREASLPPPSLSYTLVFAL
jgi:hypothetical protein